MKKLYQVRLRSEIQFPSELEIKRDEFLKLITDSGNEDDLVSESITLVSAETEDDAILEALCKYVSTSITNIDDYTGILHRGEMRNKYYINISLNDDQQNPICTKIMVDIFPKDLGI